ncbi:MAG: glutamate--tRNA ligase [Bacteroidia bacterium]|nr:glutamate--tRNA ligase [Bacteroidia bacterium]
MGNFSRVRVRFAPSPTGGLHMGGVRTALFNYLFAKKHGGDFILRIEDTDRSRFVEGAEQYIIDALKWCGIPPNEGVGFGDGPYGPYRQSERKETGIYHRYAMKLVECGAAYYAFDTEEELEQMRKRMEQAGVPSPQYNHITRQHMRNSLTLSAEEVNKLLQNNTPYVIRLKVPRNEEIKFHDIIRGWVVVNSNQVDDKVLLKSDGMPTYHLAHLADDIEMKISHVVRGEEWLPSAPAHILIYKALGLENLMPEFAHLPLILNPDGHGKISKRESRFPVFPLSWKDPREKEEFIGYREAGYFPEAFMNILALIGWNPGDNQEIMTLDEMAQKFDFAKVNKAGAKFDPEKARWFNQVYLRKKSNEELARLLMPELEKKGWKGEESYVARVCGLMKEKIHFVKECLELGNYFFEEPECKDHEFLKKKKFDENREVYRVLADALENLSSWEAPGIQETFKKTEFEGKKPDMQTFRYLISGHTSGPGLFEVAELLGKDSVIKRIKKNI